MGEKCSQNHSDTSVRSLRSREQTYIAATLALVIGVLIGFPGTAHADTTGHAGVDPSALRANWGFTSLDTGFAYRPQEDLQLLQIGARGGSFLGDNESFYAGGGARGGVGFDNQEEFQGYGYLMFGFRPTFGTTGKGIDLFLGPAVGGYSADKGSGLLAGATWGAQLNFNVGTGEELGLLLYGTANLADGSRGTGGIALTFADKSGTVFIPWSQRHKADLKRD